MSSKTMLTVAKAKIATSILAVATLAGCLGGGGGSGSDGGSTTTLAEYTARFADLQNDRGALTLTPEADFPSGSVTYLGVANFNLSDGSTLRGALGGMRVEVNFGDDSFEGSIREFIDYAEQPVDGRIDITNGVLTGNNTASLTSGVTAEAAGTIDGVTLDMTVDGGFSGDNAKMLGLYFDDRTTLRLGVGIAAR